jgi:peptidoglycan/xylan/chitin deacetylase (PgdA/CDA1 family)
MMVEISIDDGAKADMRVAKILDKYGLHGTFYIPIKKTELNLSEIKELAENHEIGGHTMTHPSDLKSLTWQELNYEITGCKSMLESIVGKGKITKFCYPRGRYNAEVIEAVKEAGFDYARTTKVGNYVLPVNLMEVHTSVHMYPRAEYEGRDIVDTAKYLLDCALASENMGYFHLWLHSWELDKLGLWGKFEECLDLLNEYEFYQENL